MTDTVTGQGPDGAQGKSPAQSNGSRKFIAQIACLGMKGGVPYGKLLEEPPVECGLHKNDLLRLNWKTDPDGTRRFAADPSCLVTAVYDDPGIDIDEDEVDHARFLIACDVMREADLYNLIEYGAPPDEYDFEAFVVSECTSPNVSAGKAAGIISRVFSKSFSVEEGFDLDLCLPAARRLLSAWSEDELIRSRTWTITNPDRAIGECFSLLDEGLDYFNSTPTSITDGDGKRQELKSTYHFVSRANAFSRDWRAKYEKENGFPDEPWIWGVAANVVDENLFGEDRHLRHGTKYFRPNQRVWCFPAFWDRGWFHRFYVIGRRRGRHGLICVAMPAEQLRNPRVKRIYSQAVIRKAHESYDRPGCIMYGVPSNSPSDRREAAEFIALIKREERERLKEKGAQAK